MSRRARIALLAAAGAIAIPAAAALAHPLPDPTVMIVAPSKDALEIRINDMTQVGDESVALKRQFHGVGTGMLAANERQDLLDFLVARAQAHLAVTQSGQRLAFTVTSRALHGADLPVDSSESLSLDVVLRATPAPARGPGGATEITVRDFRDDAHVVRCAVMAQDVRLLSVSQGTIDATAPIATGIELSRTESLTLRWAE